MKTQLDKAFLEIEDAINRLRGGMCDRSSGALSDAMYRAGRVEGALQILRIEISAAQGEQL